MEIGFYAGSFDPFTRGHLHVVTTALKLFDKVIIGIGSNSEKPRHFSAGKIKRGIDRLIEEENLTNVECIIFEGLTVAAAAAAGATFLIRGVRNGADYAYEENLAMVNQDITGIDTVYIRAGKLGMVSGTMVRELIRNDQDIFKYVPKQIQDVL